MSQVKEILFNLKKHNIVPLKYERNNKSYIIADKNKQYFIKKNNIDKSILDYLEDRNFDYIPKFINNKNEQYQISEYIESNNIPDEQKIIDLIKLTALLHNKTTHYKEIDLSEYREIYEDIENNLKYLYTYYTDLITLIETKVYMSPSEYLLARNISLIYKTIDICKQYLEKWYSEVKDIRKQRLVVLHNNLKIDHFIKNKNLYLTSWDKAKIGMPVIDLYKLYKNHCLDFDFSTLLEIYENSYPLLKEEKLLFYILISLPPIIKLREKEYINCKNISSNLDYIVKTINLLPKDSKEREKQE